jgi:hypothetical protein
MPGFLGGSSAGSGGTGGEILFPKEFIDPVTKLRVSQPENLIDTDFEYGLQPTKWETVELINNTPSFFSKSGDTTIDGIQSVITNNGTREITVTTGLDHGLAVGIPISVTGTKSVTADGSYIINSIPNSRTFTYLCRDNQVGDNSIEDLYTSIITGEFFQGSQIRVANSEGVTTDGEPISTLTVRTESTHGFGSNTPLYFLNLNSTISQEFEAANTAAKSFDSSNSATAQTFDGSNTLSSFNIDWSNSATTGGVVSTVASVSTTNNSITVTHSTETFNNLPLGSPLYYDVNTSTGFFASNPRGVVFLKTTSGLGPSQSTFQVSAAPDGEPVNIEASMSGTFQIANQARAFAGNNVNPLTQINLSVIKDSPVAFDGGNQGFAGSETNGIANIEGYSGTILVSTPPGAGLDYYPGAMVRYTSTGAVASGLVNNRTYFIDTFVPNPTPNLYNVTLKELPNSAQGLAPTGGTGTQTLTKIGVAADKDIVHARNANFSLGDMVEYTFPVGGRFTVSSTPQTKLFYFIERAYDSHNFQFSEKVFIPIAATGGTLLTGVVDEGRTWNVHVFTSTGSNTFQVESAGTESTIEYLVVAGGGGGGLDNGGGGGGGGVIRGTTAVTAQSYSITVGAGGAMNALYNYRGLPGGNSTAFGVTAVGGGGGGGGDAGGVQSGTDFANSQLFGGAGGSGGGGASESGNGTGGAASPAGQGNRGGDAFAGSGGGGGGAARFGLNATTPDAPGDGGHGVISNITGTQVRYGAGGGGGTENARALTNGARGGVGGGGTGGSAGFQPTAGAANTGSGGGGEANTTGSPDARTGTGGSGIVIVRYPTTPPVDFVPGLATGGTTTQVTSRGITYRVHSFTTVGSSTFAVQNLGSRNQFEYLIVGGGAGGWNRHQGGAGAGGVRSGRIVLSATGNYTVVVGAGGQGNNTGGSGQGNATSGGNSSVFSITANGGGQPSNTGGSGGGGGIAQPSGGSALAGQGFPGGLGSQGPTPTSEAWYKGGGGGGAGGIGGNSSVNDVGRAGDGGPGLEFDITGTNVTYASGGGGGTSPIGGGTGGYGALDGSGEGGAQGAGANGAANRGGGGGSGGFREGTNFNSGNGGSGIVIIRYPIAIAAPVATNASGGAITTVTQGDTTYRVHTFTTVGTSTFTVSTVGNLGPTEYLIVAGGGGGGRGRAGGGGGGGFLEGALNDGVLAAQNYSVVVGAGGAGATGAANGVNGGNSSVFGLTSIGGGGGGSNGAANSGNTGGSGGGSSTWTTVGANGTAGQGNNGGGNPIGWQTLVVTGGGGGAGLRGYNGTSTPGVNARNGDGGNGRRALMNGNIYAPGGGGGGDQGTIAGIGGIGGGGNGAIAAVGLNATGIGAGGGGGGRNSSGGEFNGGNGTSGIVIIRYPIAIAGIL